MFESIFNSFRETVFLKEDSNLDADLIKLREIRDKVKNRNEIDKDIKLIELGIKGEAEISDILAVIGGLFFNGQLVPAVDLGPAGETRADVVGAVFVPLGDQVILVPQRRPGADDGHLPGEDLGDLGQLVQRGLAQEAAHPGDVLVRILQKMGGHVVGRLHLHGAEFQDVKISLVDAHPLLAEKHRAGVIQLDGDG